MFEELKLKFKKKRSDSKKIRSHDTNEKSESIDSKWHGFLDNLPDPAKVNIILCVGRVHIFSLYVSRDWMTYINRTFDIPILRQILHDRDFPPQFNINPACIHVSEIKSKRESGIYLKYVNLDLYMWEYCKYVSNIIEAAMHDDIHGLEWIDNQNSIQWMHLVQIYEIYNNTRFDEGVQWKRVRFRMDDSEEWNTFLYDIVNTKGVQKDEESGHKYLSVPMAVNNLFIYEQHTTMTRLYCMVRMLKIALDSPNRNLLNWMLSWKVDSLYRILTFFAILMGTEYGNVIEWFFSIWKKDWIPIPKTWLKSRYLYSMRTREERDTQIRLENSLIFGRNHLNELHKSAAHADDTNIIRSFKPECVGTSKKIDILFKKTKLSFMGYLCTLNINDTIFPHQTLHDYKFTYKISKYAVAGYFDWQQQSLFAKLKHLNLMIDTLFDRSR